MSNQRDLLQASIEYLAAELRKRLEERAAKGEAPQPITVTGVPSRHSSTDVLSELGIDMPITHIVTGVRRPGRDSDENVEAYCKNRRVEQPSYRDTRPKRDDPTLPKISPPVLVQDDPEDLPRHYIRTQTRRPDPDKGDPGE